MLVDALCRRFNLWQRLQEEPSLDPRQRPGTGFTPAANVAQIRFAITPAAAPPSPRPSASARTPC